mgnify:CR=1 FL=1
MKKAEVYNFLYENYQKILFNILDTNIGLLKNRNYDMRGDIKILVDNTNIGTVDDFNNNRLDGRLYLLPDLKLDFDGSYFEIVFIKRYNVDSDKKLIKKKQTIKGQINDVTGKILSGGDQCIAVILNDDDNIEKNIELIHNMFYYKRLVINILKNKYVPYLHKLDYRTEEYNNLLKILDVTIMDDIDDGKYTINPEKFKKIGKMKYDDALVCFYGFERGTVCKVIQKTSLNNNISMYENYRLIV